MRVILTRNATEYDITDRLDETTDVILDQEQERAAFERVVDDVHIRASNANGIFTNSIFVGALSATKVAVMVVSDSERVLFRGTVDLSSVDLDPDKKWIEFDAFSLTRSMWDYLENQRVVTLPPAGYETMLYVALSSFLDQSLYIRGVYDQGIIEGIDLGEYEDRQIRAFASSADPLIANDGRWRELDPEMSLKELHEFMAKYYNAEFYVDPDSLMWTMKRRNTPRVAYSSNIDYALQEDNIRIRWADESGQDYLYTILFANPIPQTTFLSAERLHGGGLLAQATYHYVMVGLIGGAEVLQNPVWAVVPLGDANEGNGWIVSMNMPSTQYAGLSSRRLYRFNVANPEVGWKRIGEVSGNTATVINDGYAVSDFVNLPSLEAPVSNQITGWLGYDETTSLWKTPIFDGVDRLTNRPAGKIFDVIPKIRFTEIGDDTSIRGFNPREVLAFFAKDNTLANLQGQFLEMLLTKRRAIVPLTGTDYRLGDLYTSPVVSAAGGLGVRTNYMVKRAENNLTNEESLLEMLPV